MKLAVAYCRVSTDKKEQELSIREQKAQWTEYFAEKKIKFAKCGLLYKKDKSTKKFVKKFEKIGIYADEGISGKSLRNRMAFNQMILDAKQKKFDVIYVEDGSRFSRSTEDALKVIKDLRELGIGVYFRKEGITSLDVQSDMILTFMFAFYTNENQIKSERMKWAIHRMHINGKWNGAAPFGFDVEKGKSKLVVNIEEAKIVKLIYDLFLDEGYGTGKIVRYLNSNGIKTKKGKLWSQKQVSDILDNKLYNGEQRQHTVESVDITRHLQRQVPENEHIVVQIEKIIDDDTFNLVQLERKKRNEEFSKGNGHSNKYLLSTLLYCSHCGGTFKRKKRHSYRRLDGTQKDIGYEWTCGVNDMYGKAKCGHRNMLIEEKAIEIIKKELQLKRSIDLSELFDTYCKKKFVDNTDISKLISDKEKRDNEMRQLRQDKADGLIDEDIYKEEMTVLVKHINDIKAEISRHERRTQEIEKAELKFKEYKKMIDELDIDNLTNTQLKKIFSKIYVNDRIVNGKKEVYLRFIYRFLDSTEDELYKDEDGELFVEWVKVV